MIDSKKWYSVQEIDKQGLIPMLDTTYKVKTWIHRGLLEGNTVGKGNGKRYFIKGSSIIKFLAKWEAKDFHS